MFEHTKVNKIAHSTHSTIWTIEWKLGLLYNICYEIQPLLRLLLEKLWRGNTKKGPWFRFTNSCWVPIEKWRGKILMKTEEKYGVRRKGRRNWRTGGRGEGLWVRNLPALEKLGGVGLVKSSLAIELSRFFVYEPGADDSSPPTKFVWRGKTWNLDNSVLQCLRSPYMDMAASIINNVTALWG